MKHLTLFLFLAATFTTVFAQNDIQSLKAQLKADSDNVQVLLKLGNVYHAKGVHGDEEAVEKSEAYLTQALELDSSNALALAFLGSVYTLKGRDAQLAWNKMKYVEKGVDKIDKAVAMAPDDLNVRMLRAMNSLHLPDFFHRLQYSLKDFMFIIKSDKFRHWPVESQAEAYYYFGVALKKDGKPVKAQKYFGLAAKTAPESKWGKKANEALQTFSQSK